MTKKTRMTVTGVGIALIAAMTGCAGPGKTATSTAQPAPAQAAAVTLSGKVVETMDAGGYTYINLEKDGKQTWVAAPVTKVSVGQEIKLQPGAEIPNFVSKSLNRTFEKIIFSSGLDQSGAPAAAPAVADPNESAEPILIGKVVETMDAAQYTYICLEKDGKKAWSAVPATAVKVGDEIELLPGTPMGKFTSRRLGRTFNTIYFAGGVKGQPEGAKPASATSADASLPSGHPKIDAAAASGATPAPAGAALPSGHPKIDGAANGAAPEQGGAPQVANAITGKVVETADAGGYTYICLEKEGKKNWVAVPPVKAEVGQEIAIAPGITMTNFVSKSLNRTFESIVFSSGLAKK